MQILMNVRTNIKCVMMMDIILFLFGMEFMEYIINLNFFFSSHCSPKSEIDGETFR